jgi:hypothetical protein
MKLWRCPIHGLQEDHHGAGECAHIEPAQPLGFCGLELTGPSDVPTCEDCGHPVDASSAAEGRHDCGQCRTAAEWREYEAAA